MTSAGTPLIPLGKAVAEVVDGHCLGCNMDLAPQMYIEVQRGDTVHQCTTCYRLLIYKPPVPPDEDEKGKK